jgi:arylsulfatase A-like enzyme
MSNKPHIVIFNPDQWRGDVMGHMGDAAAVTPNLDAIVKTDAVSFRHAFCQNPVCTPSRCSFMSGWYPHVRGHRTMFHMMRPDEPVLLRNLKRNGYFVWWGGKNDLVPAQNGYGEYCDVKYKAAPPQGGWTPWPENWQGTPGDDRFYSFYVGRVHTEKDQPHAWDGDWANVHGALETIRRHQPGDKPMCLYLPLGYPHPPYAVEDPWYSMIDKAKIKARIPAPADWDAAKKPSMLKGIHQRQNLAGWTEERWTELRRTYYGMCARVDHQFGLLVQMLKDKGIYDDTAIFVFSDHGDFTGDYGLVEKTQNTFEDVLTRVPFIIKPPKGCAMKPGVRDALVELIDFPATVEAMTGIAPTHDHFGKSLLDLIAGKTTEHRDAVFCEGGRRHGETQAMERGSNQTPLKQYWPRVGLQCGEGPEHSKAVMCRTRDFKYNRRLYESDELYDLRNDPGETRNLIDDPAHRDTLLTMKERTLQFLFETGDVVPIDEDRRS